MQRCRPQAGCVERFCPNPTASRSQDVARPGPLADSYGGYGNGAQGMGGEINYDAQDRF